MSVYGGGIAGMCCLIQAVLAVVFMLNVSKPVDFFLIVHGGGISGMCCLIQAVLAVSLCALPKEFSGIFTEEKDRIVKNWHLFFCVSTGLWGGLIIGLVTEYYTSNAFQPVKVRLLPFVFFFSHSFLTDLVQSQ